MAPWRKSCGNVELRRTRLEQRAVVESVGHRNHARRKLVLMQDCARGECDNRSDRRLQIQTNLPAAIKADERMWSKRAVSIMARTSINALRSDIELQSVPRYQAFNSRCANGEVHIDRLGI
jgi:hypothetical protein